ncbi:MAG: hypothetical protein GY756_02135 [bacterium]|nr:hypothetical protein [bacterium]
MFFFILTGCLGTFDYTISPKMIREEKTYNYSVVVDNFTDRRPTVGSNHFWFYLFPGVPFTTTYYNIPEDGKMYE